MPQGFWDKILLGKGEKDGIADYLVMQYLWNLVCLENLITFLISWIILKERFISSWNSTCHPRTALSTVFLPLRILLGLYPSLFILPGNISSLCLLQQSLPFPSLFGLSVRPGTHLPNLPVLLFHRPASLPLLSLFRSSLLHSCFLFKAMKNLSPFYNPGTIDTAVGMVNAVEGGDTVGGK